MFMSPRSSDASGSRMETTKYSPRETACARQRPKDVQRRSGAMPYHLVSVAAIVLMCAAPACAEPGGRPANDAFHVSWAPEPKGLTSRIEGRVHNASRFRVTDVALQVEGLDAGGRSVGRTSAWALGDIVAGGDTAFVVDGLPGAVTYRIAVQSFDV